MWYHSSLCDADEPLQAPRSKTRDGPFSNGKRRQGLRGNVASFSRNYLCVDGGLPEFTELSVSNPVPPNRSASIRTAFALQLPRLKEQSGGWNGGVS